MSLLQPNSIAKNAATEATERQWNNYFATSVKALSQASGKNSFENF